MSAWRVLLLELSCPLCRGTSRLSMSEELVFSCVCISRALSSALNSLLSVFLQHSAGVWVRSQYLVLCVFCLDLRAPCIRFDLLIYLLVRWMSTPTTDICSLFVATLCVACAVALTSFRLRARSLWIWECSERAYYNHRL